MNTLEEMKRLVATRYLKNSEKMNRVVSGDFATFTFGQVQEDDNFLRLLDEQFACCDTAEEKLLRAKQITA